MFRSMQDSKSNFQRSFSGEKLPIIQRASDKRTARYGFVNFKIENFVKIFIPKLTKPYLAVQNSDPKTTAKSIKTDLAVHKNPKERK